MFLCGFFLGGPYNIVISSVSIEFGKKSKGDSNNISTIISLLETSGTIGAGIYQKIVPLFESYMFIAFSGINFIMNCF